MFGARWSFLAAFATFATLAAFFATGLVELALLLFALVGVRAETSVDHLGSAGRFLALDGVEGTVDDVLLLLLVLALLLCVHLLNLAHLRLLVHVLVCDDRSLCLDLLHRFDETLLLSGLSFLDLLTWSSVVVFNFLLLSHNLVLARIVVSKVVLLFVSDEPVRQVRSWFVEAVSVVCAV